MHTFIVDIDRMNMLLVLISCGILEKVLYCPHADIPNQKYIFLISHTHIENLLYVRGFVYVIFSRVDGLNLQINHF